MNKKSLRFKMMVTGLLFVLIPLLVVGGVSIYRSAGALESSAQSEALAVVKGMANMADIAVGKEMKIVISNCAARISDQRCRKIQRGDSRCTGNSRND